MKPLAVRDRTTRWVIPTDDSLFPDNRCSEHMRVTVESGHKRAARANLQSRW